MAVADVLRTRASVAVFSSFDLGNFRGIHFTAAPSASTTRMTLKSEKIVITDKNMQNTMIRYNKEKMKKIGDNLFFISLLTDSCAVKEGSILFLFHVRAET